MEDIVEDEPSGLDRLAKPEDIKKRLLSEDPVEYIKKFQVDHGVRIEGLQPILALADVLGLQRGEVYRQLKQTFYTDLTSRIATISEEDGNKLLMASLNFIEDSRLNEIPIKLLSERSGDFPDAIYELLSRMPSDVLARTVPEKPRRRTWELHEDVFRSYCDTLIESYLADRNVQRTSDNMALALDVGTRRSKTRPLVEAVGTVGSSPLLFDRFLNRAMERFAETGNPLLCTLVYDMLMAVPKAVSKQPLTDDVAHVMDKIKLKHSNDKGFGQSVSEEIANRLVELIDLLYLEVVRARDGTLPAAKLTLPPPPPQPPTAPYPTLKVKIGGRGIGGGRGRGGFGRGRGRGAGRGRLGPDVTLTISELIQRVVSDLATRLPAGQFTWFDRPVIEQLPLQREAYLMKIAEPMDISTIQSKAGSYASLAELKRDFQLIRDNAILDHGKQHQVGKAASALYKIAVKSINDYAPNLVLYSSSTGMSSVPNQFREVEDENYGNGDGTESLGPQSPSFSETSKGMDEHADEDYDDFEQDDAKSEPMSSTEPQITARPPEPPPPVKIVTGKAAQAAMILADPNTHHSLAKMMWDLLVHQVAAKGLAPRQVPVVTKLLWLTYLGTRAQDIVKAYMANEPFELLNNGPPKSTDRPETKPDLLLHSVLPLCTRFFARPGVGMHEKLVELCANSTLAREYVLRFILLEIRAGADRLALDMLRSLAPMVDHPGFRRGLSHVLKSPSGMLQLRRGAIELVFLPYLQSLKDTDGPELVDAHEFFAAVISSAGMIRLAKDGQLGMEGAVLADYAKSALTGVTPNLYLSNSFRLARQYYEDFFKEDLFIALRGMLGIPVVPAGTREASPGSTRPSPSPGTFRAQSASPSSYIPRSAGPQSTSPSYSTA